LLFLDSKYAMLHMILEIATYSIDAALLADQAGADRIELCSGPAEGGLTPGIGTIRETIRSVTKPVFVMIRPREGDFCYTHAEFNAMLEDIRMARDSGARGIVTGVLTPEGLPDTARLKQIVDLAGKLQVTFHRAFDMVKDPFTSLEMIIQCGVHRILTSGLKKTALDGVETIRALVSQAAERVGIMPGSGINLANIEEIAARTGCREFHLSAKYWADGPMQFRNPIPEMGGGLISGEYGRWLTDPEIIRRMKTIQGVQGFD